jgi:hypothetical protein
VEGDVFLPQWREYVVQELLRTAGSQHGKVASAAFVRSIVRIAQTRLGRDGCFAPATLRGAARLLIQSEFSVLKANLMAIPRIVAIFSVSARVQLDDPISSAVGIQPGGGEQSIRASRKTRNRTMKMKYFLAALLLVPSLAAPAMVQARSHFGSIPPRAIEGREVAAPPWSAACMTDHGPSQCDEPMWVYGSPGPVSRYKNAF